MPSATIRSVFDTARPAMTETEIASLLAENWGITGRLSPLLGERDQSVLIEGPAGRHVLKIANAVEDAGLLAMQNAALAHVARTDPGLGVQRLVPGCDGAVMITHRGHFLRLMGWLPGRLCSAVSPDPALLASLGTVLGRLSRALRGFGHPAAHRPDFLWNLDAFAALEPWADDVQGDARALVARIFGRHAAGVAPRLAGLCGAVLHHDANDNNLLVAEAAPEVTGTSTSVTWSGAARSTIWRWHWPMRFSIAKTSANPRPR